MNIWAWILIGWFATNVIVGAAVAGRAKKAAPAPDTVTVVVRVIIYILIYAGLALILLAAIGVM